MLRIISTYIAVVVLLSLGFFGVGTMAKAAELRDPMQPPPFALQKSRQPFPWCLENHDRLDQRADFLDLSRARTDVETARTNQVDVKAALSLSPPSSFCRKRPSPRAS